VLKCIYEPLVDVVHERVLMIPELERNVLLRRQQHGLLDMRDVLANARPPQRVDYGEEPHHIGHAGVHALGGRVCDGRGSGIFAARHGLEDGAQRHQHVQQLNSQARGVRRGQLV
jgi:hypothetical protein